MVNLDMSLSEMTSRAYTRGLPARKWAHLAEKWLDGHGVSGKEREHAILRALFDHLPDPPALILAYLSYALPSSLASPRTATIHLLFQLESTSIPSHTLSSICTAILANPSALDASEPLPSSLPSPDEVSRPDVGPSSPPIPATTWTLSLLLPLLRLCTDKNCPSPITQMVGKVLSIVAPYPAPPFDVGLESSQLMGSLPDSISMPLRESLSGLMTDLAISEVTQAQAPVSASTAIDVPPGNGMDGASPLDGARLSSINPREIYTDSLPNALSMLLAAYRQQPRIDRNDSYSSTPPRPPKGLLDLLKLGWAISSNGEQLLSDLLSVILDQVSGDLSGMEGRNVDAWVLAVEDIPILVRRWKDQPGPKTPFPENLSTILKNVLDAKREMLDGHATWQQATWEKLTANNDGDSDEGAFAPPDGWSYVSLREGLVRRLADLDLLSANDVQTVLPDLSIAPPWLSSGESLLNRISQSPKSHLEALAMTVVYSPGAARSFASELIQTIQACPGTPPPENLFINLSSSPAILACLAAYCPPATMLETMTTSLLEGSEDPSIRSEDPQGSMTRFGEGVILVETFAAQYKLPLPALLKEARVSLTMSELTDEEKGMMNGWVKALFGSDGIDDEILLSTTPPNFCRLGCGLFQQAITATAIGQIDLDTLHSGLSYFSQPLLSWSLGGIVTWLCTEAHRNGSLSALHLDVLQNLLISSALPDGLLRATGAGIASLLAPHAGLGAVIKSSGFDAEAVKAKLEAVGVSTLSLPTEVNSLAQLSSTLQALRQPESALPDWSSTLITALRSAAHLETPIACVQTILTEIFTPNILDPSGPDPIANYAPLLLVTPLLPNGSVLLETLLERYLPSMLDSPSSMFTLMPDQSRSLARLIRLGLLLLDAVNPILAGRLVTGLVEEITYHRSRGVEPARTVGGVNKKRKMGGGRGLSSGGSELITLLGQAFSDEASKSRWPILDSL